MNSSEKQAFYRTVTEELRKLKNEFPDMGWWETRSNVQYGVEIEYRTGDYVDCVSEGFDEFVSFSMRVALSYRSGKNFDENDMSWNCDVTVSTSEAPTSLSSDYASDNFRFTIREADSAVDAVHTALKKWREEKKAEFHEGLEKAIGRLKRVEEWLNTEHEHL